jgi:hypothetical protein
MDTAAATLGQLRDRLARLAGRALEQGDSTMWAELSELALLAHRGLDDAAPSPAAGGAGAPSGASRRTIDELIGQALAEWHPGCEILLAGRAGRQSGFALYRLAWPDREPGSAPTSALWACRWDHRRATRATDGETLDLVSIDPPERLDNDAPEHVGRWLDRTLERLRDSGTSSDDMDHLAAAAASLITEVAQTPPQ